MSDNSDTFTKPKPAKKKKKGRKKRMLKSKSQAVAYNEDLEMGEMESGEKMIMAKKVSFDIIGDVEYSTDEDYKNLPKRKK